MSCTAGSTWGQVGTAWDGRWHQQLQWRPQLVPRAQPVWWGEDAGPHLGSDATSPLSADARGVAGSQAGGQPKA